MLVSNTTGDVLEAGLSLLDVVEVLSAGLETAEDRVVLPKEETSEETDIISDEVAVIPGAISVLLEGAGTTSEDASKLSVTEVESSKVEQGTVVVIVNGTVSDGFPVGVTTEVTTVKEVVGV